VTIAGITNDGCDDCGDLNDTYYLRPAYGEACKWRCVKDFACSIEEISLEVLLAAGNYKILVTLGDHTWEKDYGGSRPGCIGISGDVLSSLSSGGGCASTSSTATITASSGSNCECNQCSPCADGTVPDAWQVVIAGITNDECNECTSANGTFVCEPVDQVTPYQCTWDYTFASPLCEAPYCTPGYIRVSVVDFGGVRRVRVGLSVCVSWSLNLFPNARCDQFNNLDLPFIGGAWDDVFKEACGITSSTCKLTAL
jgi:hypothetical protein